jgi:integrase
MRARFPIDYLWNPILYHHPNGYYYAIFSRGGKQTWKSLATSNLREARALLRQLKAERAKVPLAGAVPADGGLPAAIKDILGEFRSEMADWRNGKSGDQNGGQHPEPSTPKIDFTAAVKKHFETLTFRSHKTRQMYDSQKSRLLKLCFDWEHFSPAALWNRTQAGEGHRQPPGNSSLNHFRLYLCALSTWMEAQGWISEQLVKEARSITRKKVHNRKPVIPHPEQVETLLRQIEMDDRETGQFFRFLTYTGARIGSALKVKWSNVHWDTKQIDFRLKGDEEKAIWLYKKAVDLLEKRRKELEPRPDDRIFPFDNNWIRRARILLGKWAKALELQISTPHMFRHYHASRLLMDQLDLASVSSQLGHSNVQTTMKAYLHSVPSHIQARLDEVNL